MSGNKTGLSLLVTFIAISFAANPLLAMEGVDNLTVQHCSSKNKAAVEDAFRAANLLTHYSEMALAGVSFIEEHHLQPEMWEKSVPRNFRVDKYTGLQINLQRVMEEYERIFGSNYEDTIRLKYATMNPMPLSVVAVCEKPKPGFCEDDVVAFVIEHSKSSAKIGICPMFFEYRLEDAKKLTLYKSIDEIALFRAGVVVHEFMHLNFMRTESGLDFEYGLEHVLKLPPKRAIKNPDSFHAFTMLIYGLGVVPKCVRLPDRWKNC